MERKKTKIAVLLSGGGTTYQHIQERIAAGEANVETAVVISSRADAYGLERARSFGVPAFVVPRKEFNQHGDNAVAMFNRAMLDVLEPYKPDLIVLAGFMCLLSPEFVDRYRGRIINTHPALIPAFCGHEYYGDRVHKAVVEYGVKVTGCTIHFVDEVYDNGPIILQQAVPVYDSDTYEEVAARVQAAEKPLFFEAIKLFSEGGLEIRGRKVFRTGGGTER